MEIVGEVISFGPFELHRERRRLLRDGKLIRLGSRALDLLLVLIDNAGRPVSKEQLIASVWPSVHVENIALRVHINALRKVLGEGRPQAQDLITWPGRGYQFVTPVRIRTAAPEAPPEPVPSDPYQDRLPAGTHIIGRDLEIEEVTERLTIDRCVTIVGPGGIGKTTVGLGVMRRVAPQFPCGVFFVDLAPITDARHIPSAIAAVMGITGVDDAPIERLVSLIQNKTALIMLDNCEHLAGAVARVVTALTARPNLKILATSRERLHVAQENVYRLPTLKVPPEPVTLPVEEVLGYSAVALFVERAVASNARFELSPSNVAMVVEICRELDGMALAIELAASRMDSFGVADIASMLSDRFRVLRKSRRADGESRHSSLVAMLDWSYDLLDRQLQTFLQRIGAFAARFTLDDAMAMVDQTKMSRGDVVDCLAELADKSFITVDLSENAAYYRLYETMREYVRHRSQSAGSLDGIRRDHATYMVRLFTDAWRNAERYRAADWLALYGRYLEDVRFAIDWAMTTPDKALAISLTASASTLWVYSSLLRELQRRCQWALAELGPEATQGGAREMALFAALSYATVNLYGPTPEGTKACQAALDIARKIGDYSSQVKALLALWNGCFANGEVRQSMVLAQEFMTVASKLGQADVLVAHRMLGSSHFYLGDVQKARKHMEIMVSGYGGTHHDAHLARFGFGQLASGRGLLAFYLRYQGLFDSAMEATRRSVQEAVDSGHAMTICGVLGTTSVSNTIAIGHLDEAQRLVEILGDRARTHGLRRWEDFAIGYEGVICARAGKLDEALLKLSRALERAEDRANTRYMSLFMEYALALGAAGNPEGGLAVIDEILERLSGTGESWFEPELLRCRAELNRKGGAEDETVEALFRQAIVRAEELHALAFQLQAAKGLARHLHDRGRTEEGFAVLQPVVELFVEGLDSPEILETKHLLETLGGSEPGRPRLVYSSRL